MLQLVLLLSLQLPAQSDAAVAALTGGFFQPDPAVIMMQEAAYQDAVRRLMGLSASDESDDLRLVMAAEAAYYAEDWQALDRAVAEFREKHRDSGWRARIDYLDVQKMVANDSFQSGFQAFRTALDNLMASERREKLAEPYLEMAAAISFQEEERQNDYRQAAGFMVRALELGVESGKVQQAHVDLARIRIELSQWTEATKELEAYLESYPSGSLKDHALYLLGDVKIRRGDRREGRDLLTELLDDFPSSEWRPKALLELALSYNVPNTRSKRDQSFALEHLGTLRSQHAETDEGKRAAMLYAETLARSEGQQQQALDAYQFVRETYAGEELGGDALVKAARLQEDRGNFEDAIDMNQAFLADYPNHPDWRASQQKIIELSYRMVVRELGNERWDEALTAIDSFVARYPVDGRSPGLEIQKAEIAAKREDWESALAQFEQLTNKYRNQSTASHAWFRIAEIRETQFEDYPAAIEAYESVRQNPWRQQALEVLAKLRGKELQISTDQVASATEEPKATLKVRNVEAVNLRAYPLNLEEYFEKTHSLTNVEDLDIQLIEPEWEWDVEIDEYEEYRLFEPELELPMTEAGAYVIRAASEEHKSTILYLISDLAIQTLHTRKALWVYAHNLETHQLKPGVDVWLSNGRRVVARTTTDADGTADFDLEALEEDLAGSMLSVLAFEGNHFAALRTNRNHASYVPEGGIRGVTLSDKPAYQPGEKVHLKVILRQQDGGTLGQPEDTQFKLRVRLPGGASLADRIVSMTRFGTLFDSFEVPHDAPQGRIDFDVLNMDDEQIHQTQIPVITVEREDYDLEFELDKPFYLPGENASVTLKATYLTGLAYADKTVTVTLPDGETEILTTDDNGEAILEVDLSAFDEQQAVFLRATLEGSELTFSQMIRIQLRSFSIGLTQPNRVLLPETQAQVGVMTRTNDDDAEPIAQSLTVTVTRVFQGVTSVVLDDSVETAEDGSLDWTFDPPGGGRFSVTFAGVGSTGFETSSSIAFEVIDPESGPEIKLLPIRGEVAVGEETDITFYSRVESGRAMLIVDGNGLIDAREIPLSQGVNRLPLLIEDTFIPNVHLHVLVANREGTWRDMTPLSVQKGLEVTVTPAAERVDAGGEATVTIRTETPNGRGVPADVALIVLDEASLRPLQRRGRSGPDLEATFYQQRVINTVGRNGSTPFTYLGQQQAIEAALLAARREAERQALSNAFDASLDQAMTDLEESIPSDFDRFGSNGPGSMSGGGMGATTGASRGAPSAEERARPALAELGMPAQGFAMDPSEPRAARREDSAGESLLDDLDGISLNSEGRIPLWHGRDEIDDRRQSLSLGLRMPDFVDIDDEGWWSVLRDQDQLRVQGRLEAYSQQVEAIRNAQEPLVAFEARGGLTMTGTGGDGLAALQNGPAASRDANALINADLEDLGMPNLGIALDPLLVNEQGMTRMVYRQANDEVVVRFHSDLAFYTSSVVTGDNGEVTVSFPLPDNATRWVAIAYANTDGALFGSGEASFQATRPMSLQLELPSRLTTGDIIALKPRVLNDQAEATSGSLSISLQGSSTGPASVLTEAFSVGPRRVAELSLEPLAIENQFDIDVSIDGDRIKRSVPVDAFGELRATERVGSTNDEVQEVLSIEGATPANLQVELLRPSDDTLAELESRAGVGPLVRGSEPLTQLSLALGRYQVELARDADDRLINQRKQALESAVSRVGTNPITGPVGDPRILAATQLQLLAQARKLLETPANNALSNLISTVSRHMNAEEATSALRGYTMAALAEASAIEFATLNRSYRDRDRMSLEAKVYLALALHKADRRAEAGTMAEDITENLDLASSQAVVVGSEAALRAAVIQALIAIGRDTSRHAERLASLVGDLQPPIVICHVEDGRPWGHWWPWWQPADLDVIRYAQAYGTFAAAGGAFRLPESVQVYVNGDLAETVSLDAPRNLMRVADVPSRSSVRLALSGSGHVGYRIRLERFESRASISDNQRQGRLTRIYGYPKLEVNGQKINRGRSIVRDERNTPSSYESRPELEQAAVGQAFPVYLSVRFDEDQEGTVVMEDVLPAGVELVPDSLRGASVAHEVDGNRLRIYINSRGSRVFSVNYEVMPIFEGRMRALPARAYPLAQPEVLLTSASHSLAIGPRGTNIFADYPLSPDELWATLTAASEQKDYEEVLKLSREISDLPGLIIQRRRDLSGFGFEAAMAVDNDQAIVLYSEQLREINPAYDIKLKEIRRVADAYSSIGEYERGYQVLRGVYRGTFNQESTLVNDLVTKSRVGGATDLMEQLLKDYPNLLAVRETYYAFAQELYGQLAEYAQNPIDNPLPPGVSPSQLFSTVRDMLIQYITFFAGEEGVDEVAFTLLNMYLDSRQLESVAEAAPILSQRHKDGSYVDGIQFVAGYALMRAGNYAQAKEFLQPVAEQEFLRLDGRMAPSPNRHLATHMLGQIFHADGELEAAIEAYEAVEDEIADAAATLEFLRHVELSVPDLLTFTTLETPEARLTTKGLDEVSLSVYRVDFMLLALLENDLSRITNVNLSGIDPVRRETLEISAQSPYVQHHQTVPLPLTEPGAYLMVFRSDDREVSSIAMVSDIEIEMLTDTQDGRLRFLVRDPQGRGLEDVRMRFLGARGGYHSVDTDLRGLADGPTMNDLRTIIAEHEGQYAVLRFGRVEREVPRVRGSQPPRPAADEVLNNIRMQQQEIQTRNRMRYNEQMNEDAELNFREIYMQ